MVVRNGRALWPCTDVRLYGPSFSRPRWRLGLRYAGKLWKGCNLSFQVGLSRVSPRGFPTVLAGIGLIFCRVNLLPGIVISCWLTFVDAHHDRLLRSEQSAQAAVHTVYTRGQLSPRGRGRRWFVFRVAETVSWFLEFEKCCSAYGFACVARIRKQRPIQLSRAVYYENFQRQSFCTRPQVSVQGARRQL